jgi:hypothetical protein
MRRRSFPALFVSVVVLSICFTGTASSEPPPSVTPPFKCFQAWARDGEGLDYFREGWVGARVADVNGIFLGCGDESTGVIHIAHPDSNSTSGLHPITEANQNTFLQCFVLIAQSGIRVPDKGFPQTRTRAEYTYYVNSDKFGRVPQKATIIFDNAARFAYTVFTSSGSFSPQGDNWPSCISGLV